MGSARKSVQGGPIAESVQAVKAFYTKAEMAKIFEVSVRTIETWTATGRLPSPRKVGRKWTAWVKAEIDALLVDWGKAG